MLKLLFLLSTIFVSYSFNIKKIIDEGKIPSWMHGQIKDDFSSCESKINQELINKTMQDLKGKFSVWSPTASVARIKIENNKILIFQNYIDYSGYDIRLKNFLRTLTDLSKIIILPDIDFIINVADCNSLSEYYQVPVFTFCVSKNRKKNSILVPDCDSCQFWLKDIEQVYEGNRLFPWLSKKKQAFWRGNTTGFVDEQLLNISNYKENHRMKLVALSRANKQLLDAKFNYTFNIDKALIAELNKLGYIANTVSVKNHIRYKYQICIDGYSASWARLYWQLACNCVTLKQDSQWITWFHNALVPYKHYIPVKNDMGDLIDKIKWAKENDGKVAAIANNANKFFNENLRYEHILLYLFLVLNEYAKLQVF